MPTTSRAFTIPTEPSAFASGGIHVRPTRILRSQPVGAGCSGCRSDLEIDAQFCGMCGRRVRTRTSRLGAVIDGLYEVNAMIAEGSNATIYRARCLETGRDLALKIMHTDRHGDDNAKARFHCEARSLVRVRSAHAVAGFDHGETDDGAPYIAMELLGGERLDVRLRARGAHPWNVVLNIMRDLSDALAELHAHGIVHRDVSARNVMMLPDGSAKLIDFGLAKLRIQDGDEELSRSGRAVGALGYAAPELLAGEPCDSRADLHALGMIGWELVLGRLPCAGASMPRSVPASVERLLRRCSAHDRAERFATAAELRQAIDELLSARAEGELPSLARRHKRIYAHTSAFELLPPRIVIARGSEPEIEAPRQPRSRWKLWAVALIACGIGLGTAVAGCV
jgi:serine/threonine protein kinase